MMIVLLAVLFLAGCADYPTEPVSPQSAGKSTEALGFDFRINHDGTLWDDIPYEYAMEIRRAAQRWESVIAWSDWVKHLKMPERPFSLEFGTDGLDEKLEVRSPASYLGWADIEL